MTWTSDDDPVMPRPGPVGWVLILLRGVAVGGLTFGCLLILLAVRLVERPIFGAGRPWTPHITQFVCRNALRLMGIGFRTEGQVMQGAGAVVANHGSWLDIFVLNARKRIYFVSKSEVAGWPGIGWLARATGTVFIARRSSEAGKQKQVFEDRLLAGHKLLFFPEGTSTDGRRVLPFKSTLFAAFFADNLKDVLQIQPVSVIYHAPVGQDPRYYGWWGDMGFGEHLLQVLATARQGRVDVIYHSPVRVSDFANRKALAEYCGMVVREGVESRLGGRPDA